MDRRIVFTGKNVVSLETFTSDIVKEKHVKVRTLYSMISTGTEKTPLAKTIKKPDYIIYSKSIEK